MFAARGAQNDKIEPSAMNDARMKGECLLAIVCVFGWMIKIVVNYYHLFLFLAFALNQQLVRFFFFLPFSVGYEKDVH